ncbi:hypothetical protein LZ32DRAFT_264030 [Colletotrichum eremochloae]|nr:hypothetical protein LZ32DRAFT_264030 [Colletotrichum eremochloae]
MFNHSGMDVHTWIYKWIYMWGAEAIYNLVGAYLASLSEVDTSSSACCCCNESSTSLALSSPSNSHFDSASASLSSLRVL